MIPEEVVKNGELSMERSSLVIRILSVLTILMLVATIYLTVIRPWYMRWGATEEEVVRVMPGDEIVAEPTFNSTRAVTIEGSPDEIWPWLVQIGYGRAGFYGYDLIENLGSQRGLESAKAIIPELQQFEVGDEMPISVVATYKIRAMETGSYLIWADKNMGAFTWGLYPLNEHQTRLVLRFRFHHQWYDWLFTDWADPIAVRKILLGVKDRAEGRVEPLAHQNAEIALWAVAAVEFLMAIILIFKLRQWWWGWLVAMTAASILLLTLYVFPPLWFGISLEAILLASMILIKRDWLKTKEKQNSRPTGQYSFH
jgi:hypothetical protein